MAPQAKRPRVPAASASVAPPKRQKKSKVDDGAANPPPKAPADAKPAEASPSPKRRRRSVVASADAKPAEASPRGAVGDGQLPPAPVPGPDSATMFSLPRPRLVGEDRPPPLQGHVPGSCSGWQDAVIVISNESPAKAGSGICPPAHAGPPALVPRMPPKRRGAAKAAAASQKEKKRSRPKKEDVEGVDHDERMVKEGVDKRIMKVFSPFAREKGCAFCTYPCEVEKVEDAFLVHSGPHSAKSHDKILKALQKEFGTVQLPKRMTQQALKLLQKEYKWEMTSVELADWIETMTRRLRNLGRVVTVAMNNSRVWAQQLMGVVGGGARGAEDDGAAREPEDDGGAREAEVLDDADDASRKPAPEAEPPETPAPRAKSRIWSGGVWSEAPRDAEQWVEYGFNKDMLLPLRRSSTGNYDVGMPIFVSETTTSDGEEVVGEFADVDHEAPVAVAPTLSATQTGEPEDFPAAQPSPPTFDRGALFKGVMDGTAEAAFQQMGGATLTEENLKLLERNLKSSLQGELPRPGAGQDAEDELIPRSDLTVHEGSRYRSLMKVLEGGGWDSRSALANRFRQKFPNIKMKSLTPDEAVQWQQKFCKEEMKELTVHKHQETSWRRVDTTTAKYRPFGRVVQDLGGWTDAMAIAGATTGCSKCLILGHPWWRIHPQTEMLEFIILESGWQETFEKCWTECKTQMITGGGVALGPATASPSPGLPLVASTRKQPATVPQPQAQVAPQKRLKGKQGTKANREGAAEGAPPVGEKTQPSAKEQKKIEQEKQRLANEKAEKAPISNVVHADIVFEFLRWVGQGEGW